jgi:lipopolysaccharide transport system ATP-binding protein
MSATSTAQPDTRDRSSEPGESDETRARRPGPGSRDDPRSRAEPVIRVEDLGKCYEIYARPFDRLKQTLWRGRRQFYREFWALRDVSFEVRRGEALGIIGRNGSGKSTLLQIVAGTLRPTEGRVEVRGRVHALLELGSGFNPEFTGRENVFLNAAVLGVPPAEARARFDEIAAFADIGDFLDQPIKTYSTGMVVRLAFAVQVLLRPDILIIDEALAVGDAAFQMKCFNRMQQLREQGVSVVLVTHDTQTVRSFCHRAIWLDQGRIRQEGRTVDVTSNYVQFLFKELNADRPAPGPARAAPASAASGEGLSAAPLTARRKLTPVAGRSDLVRWGSGELRVTGATIDNGKPGIEAAFSHGERLHVEFEVEALKDLDAHELGLGFAFRNVKALNIINSSTYDEGRRFPPLKAGQKLRVAFELDNILMPGTYALVCVVEDRTPPTYHYYDFVENALLFHVLQTKPIHSLVLPAVEQMIWVDDAAPDAPEAHARA